MGASGAVKERLRKMRQKYHLGEYSKKSIENSYNFDKPKRPAKTKRKRVSRGGITMKHKGRTGSRKGFGSVMSLANSALVGLGAAHVAGYVPVNVPGKEELAGALGAFVMKRNLVSAAVGAGAVYATKRISANTNLGSGSSGIVLN